MKLKLQYSKISRAPIQYKDDILQYRKSHCGDKTILRQSYLHIGISCTGKTTSLYWIGAQADTLAATGSLHRQVISSCGNDLSINMSLSPMSKGFNYLPRLYVQMVENANIVWKW